MDLALPFNSSPAAKKPNHTLFIIIAVVLVAIFGVIGLITYIVGDSGCSGPNPTGSECSNLPIQPNDTKVHSLLQDLQRFTNSSQYLVDHASDLDMVRNDINALQIGLTNHDPAYSSIQSQDKTLIPLLQKMQKEIDQIRNTAKTDPTGAKTVADQFESDLAQLNQLTFGVATCGVDGKCLQVPAIDQGSPQYCGRTSMMMLLMYYNKGITPWMSAYVKPDPNLGYIMVTNSTNPLSPANINQNIPDPAKHDWDYYSADHFSSADQMYQAIKASINGGDPVIIYTHGAIWSGASHIVLIVGYNDSDQSLYINNPKVKGIFPTSTDTGVNMITSGNSSHVLTAQWMYTHNGQDSYGHFFIARKAWFK
ncbi:C39 family peptidase [Patescibacteria group bacterium]|nr:C39 family peptidase [Patescibacteria group bacterium]